MLVSAVVADPRDFQIPAIAKIPAPALEARAVLASVPADADALAPLPLRDTGAQFIDDTGDFVPWNARILNAGPRPFLNQRVAVADATGLDLDANVSRTRLRDFALDNLKIASWALNLGYFH